MAIKASGSNRLRRINEGREAARERHGWVAATERLPAEEFEKAVILLGLIGFRWPSATPATTGPSQSKLIALWNSPQSLRRLRAILWLSIDVRPIAWPSGEPVGQEGVAPKGDWDRANGMGRGDASASTYWMRKAHLRLTCVPRLVSSQGIEKRDGKVSNGTVRFFFGGLL